MSVSTVLPQGWAVPPFRLSRMGRKAVAVLSLAAVLLSGSTNAWANPRLARLVGESFARYVLIESAEGRTLTREVLGFEASRAKDLRALVSELDRTGMRALGMELESRLDRIREGFRSRRSLRSRVGILSEADRIALRQLAAEELAAEITAQGRIRFTARDGSARSFSVNRNRFMDASESAAAEAALARQYGNPLADAFPATIETGELSTRVSEFVSRNSSRVRLVEDVRFQMPGGYSMQDGRKVLVISTDGLEPRSLGVLIEDYLSTVARETVSFPLGESAGHLYSRLGTQVFDFMWNGVSKYAYRASGSARLEPVVLLSVEEQMRLRKFVENAHRNPGRTVGEFGYEGVRSGGSRGRLDDNRPSSGKHNCTSWITTAEIGEGGQSLHGLVGAGGWQVNTNPGWWSSFLLASPSARARVPFAVYWTNEPLAAAEARVRPGELMQWSFNPH